MGRSAASSSGKQHPSYKLLEPTGFHQEAYQQYRRRCLKERKTAGALPLQACYTLCHCFTHTAACVFHVKTCRVIKVCLGWASAVCLAIAITQTETSSQANHLEYGSYTRSQHCTEFQGCQTRSGIQLLSEAVSTLTHTCLQKPLAASCFKVCPFHCRPWLV